MRDYHRINEILDDIENLLDGMLLSGISVIREGELRELERLEGKCSSIGLKQASKLLSVIKTALDKKRHSLNFDSVETMEGCCALGSYIWAVRSKIKLDMVEESLLAEEEINMGKERI
jgi:hypothetical protein